MMEEEYLSMKCSRNSTCSNIVLCVKWPPVVTSRHMPASMSRPEQKRRSNMLSGKDKSGLACINMENLAQTATIDSFTHYSKSRIVVGRETIWDIVKSARENLSLSSFQSSFVLPMMCVPLFCLPMREMGNNVHLSVSCVMPKMLRHEHISSSLCRWLQGFSASRPEKGCARTMAIKLGRSS